jgi:hypothetical protein
VIEKRAVIYKKQEDAKKADKKQRGFFGSIFGGSGKKQEASSKIEADALANVDELIKEVRDIGESEQQKLELVHSNLKKRKDVPDFLVNFRMDKL